ncbi:hypothetical protein BDA99DRAFT_493138 [Phascolomyces articulosus]|uniref:Uncharacterized protein n=1 Tax=Phascolomyces articulosus TaxID=60185 RepID=A0AAD5KD74_9FUNG|nr:hypothetical protein BDA99DRAFT_493138 [Phascolomyces articulosus]
MNQYKSYIVEVLLGIVKTRRINVAFFLFINKKSHIKQMFCFSFCCCCWETWKLIWASILAQSDGNHCLK